MKKFYYVIFLAIAWNINLTAQCAPNAKGNGNGKRFIMKNYASEADRNNALSQISSVVIDGVTYNIEAHTDVLKIRTTPASPDNTFSTLFSGTVTLNLSAGGTMDCIYAANVLPIELISFEVNTFERLNHLTWITASEYNNNKFIIERSLNGKNFIEIGEVKSFGNAETIQKYDYKDFTLNNYYYRLKQVDFDGLFTYSDIKISELKVGTNVVIFPNEVKQGEMINIKDTNLSYKVYSMNAELMITSIIKTNIIDTSNLKPGMYVVSFSNGISKKIIIN